MEFSELIAAFAACHNVEDLAVKDGAAVLDIDGIIVNLVANEVTLTISAEIGDPPAVDALSKAPGDAQLIAAKPVAEAEFAEIDRKTDKIEISLTGMFRMFKDLISNDN